MALFGGPSAPVSRLEELKRLLQKDPTSRQFLALAEEYRRHGKYRDAVITLERGLQMHSTSVAAHVALGKTYQQLDRLEDAIRAFTNALRIDRENLVAIRQLAEVYLAKGEKVEAIKKLKLYRGLKAGDRDVNEIIQKLEEEMAAAVAERPVSRSGVRAAFSELPELGRPSTPSWATSGVRRAVTMPRPDRSGTTPVPASVPAPLPVTAPRDVRPELVEMTYTGAALSRAFETRAEPRAAEEPPVPPPATLSGTAPVPVMDAPVPPEPTPPSDVLFETTPAAIPAPEAPVDVSPPVLSPFTAPIAAVREDVAPEAPPFPLEERDPDVPEEEATAPFTFPVDLYRTEAATSSAGPAGWTSGEAPAAPPLEVAAPAFAPPESAPPAELPEAPSESFVSETLGDLYLTQGHVADARETYRTLAETEEDEARARSLREKASGLSPERTDHPSLRRLARRFPKRAEATVDDLHVLLRNLVESTEGIRAATLTDLEGLPVVMAGPNARDASMETLVAELTSFLKNVRRTIGETGAGELDTLAVAGQFGGAVVSRVNADYSLILHVDPVVAALGEIRWEAARTARAIRPAVR